VEVKKSDPEIADCHSLEYNKVIMVKEGHNYNVPKISCLFLQLKIDALAAVLCSPTKNNFPPTVKRYT
jgi:hypothetical protein